MIFDTHAHYDDSVFEEDRVQVLEGLKGSGVAGLVNSGASLASSRRAVDLAGRYDFIYASVGVHPDEIGALFGLGEEYANEPDKPSELEIDEELDFDAGAIKELEDLAGADRVKAVGEIGLDYHWNRWPKRLQQRAFIRQWELAISLNKPVVIHSRDAAEDTLEIVKAMREKEKAAGRELRVDMHCYSYSLEQAKIYYDLGLYFGVGGVVTFKNSKKLQEVVKFLPLERILLETDCPYLSPEPFRGKRNSSDRLSYVAEKIAELKGVSPEEVYKTTYDNAVRFYGI